MGKLIPLLKPIFAVSSDVFERLTLSAAASDRYVGLAEKVYRSVWFGNRESGVGSVKRL